MKKCRYRSGVMTCYTKFCSIAGATIYSMNASVRLMTALVLLAVILTMTGCTSQDAALIAEEKYGTPDIAEVNASNAANMSGTVDTDDGCYCIAGGKDRRYEIRWYPSGGGVYDVIYSSVNEIRCLGLIGEQLYFVSVSGEESHLFSMDTDGGDIRMELEKYNVQSVFAYGSRLYYVCNGYGNSKSGALLGVMDLSGGSTGTIKVLDSSDINRVLEYRNMVYILYAKHSDYRGHIMTMPVGAPDALRSIPINANAPEDIYSIAPANGRIYISDITGSSTDKLRRMYSMEPDGSDIQEIATAAGSYMTGYGDHIIYVNIRSAGDENSYELRSIGTDGKGDALICSRPMMTPGIAHGQIYYFDPQSSVYCRMAIDGGSFEII